MVGITNDAHREAAAMCWSTSHWWELLMIHMEKRLPCGVVLHINFSALQFTLKIVVLLHFTPWNTCDWWQYRQRCPGFCAVVTRLYQLLICTAAPEVRNGDGERWSERCFRGIGRGLYEDAFPPLSWRAWGHREPLSKYSWTETKFLPHRVWRQHCQFSLTELHLHMSVQLHVRHIV
jgi:hypothetical protein